MTSHILEAVGELGTLELTIVLRMKLLMPRQKSLWFGVAAMLLFVAGCADAARYNSRDLTLLPCERIVNEFFLPVEFDAEGNFVYSDQVDAVKAALHRVDQVYVFAHGWDKTTETAEIDYQKLVCRFHTHTKSGNARSGKAIIIGVFWPSTEFPRWLNFWKIKNRVDRIASAGFPQLMEVISDISLEQEKRYKLAFIGHSFGGRLIVHGLQHYIRKPTSRTFRFISSLEQLQLVLLNAAVGEPSLLPQNVNFSSDYLGYKQNWNSELFVNGLRDRYSKEFIRNNTLVDFSDLRLFWIPTITELAAYTDLRLYNVMSSNDMADRYLYRIGSIGERGGPLCAIGACKLSQWQHSVEVSNSGTLSETPNLKKSNVWNVDASEVVYSHSDIYKGRVANLIWELLSLELPPIEEDDLVTDFPDYKEKEVTSFNSLASQYEYFRRTNVQAMVEVNASRLLGQRRKLELQRVVSLLFDLDDHFKKHEWVLAETTLKSLIDANECIAGWWWQESLGVITPGLLYDSKSSSIVRGKVCHWPQLIYLLAVVMYNQGDCSEAVRLLKIYREVGLQGAGIQHLASYGGKNSLDYVAVEQFILNSCEH